MMKTSILLILSTFILLSYSKGQEKNKSILAVFPHSDDETAMGVVLAKYTSQYKIFILYIVDNVDTSGVDITPEGDSINHIKIAEAKCACTKLGVEPIFLGLGRLDARKGLGAYFTKIKKFKSVLTKKIEELNPSVIITFGPDGESGHYEHQIVSNITTEIILYNGWVERYPLYYIGWPKEKKPIEQLEGTGEVNKRYLTVTIHYTEEDEAKALESYKCYKNQFSPEDFQEWKDEHDADKSNIYYFRQFAVTNKTKKDLFDK